MPRRRRTGREPRIVAMGGGGFMMEPENPLLDDHVLALADVERPRVCLLPTASHDEADLIEAWYEAFPPARAEATHLELFAGEDRDPHDVLLRQDVIYVGGGNTADLLAVWREWSVDETLRRAWRQGVVLAGLSAGALCWFEGGVTDSFGPLAPLRDGLRILPGSACPHYDSEEERRPAFLSLVADGTLPAGIALDDGAGAVYRGTELAEVVGSRPEARAFLVSRGRGRAVERRLPVRFLGGEDAS